MRQIRAAKLLCIAVVGSFAGCATNTSLTGARSAGAGDEVLVSFEHAGWKDAAPEAVAQGWTHFIGSLKSYVETGAGQPW